MLPTGSKSIVASGTRASIGLMFICWNCKRRSRNMTEKQSAVTTVTTPSDREIVITRVINAPRTLVFDAWTNPVHLPHWMLGPEGWTMPICEVDLRPGGIWHFVWRRADGSEMDM